MCLYIDPDIKPNFVDGKITAYKVLCFDQDGVYTPYQETPFTPEFNSGRVTKLRLDERGKGEVEHGIHVYLNLEGVIDELMYRLDECFFIEQERYTYIPVTCYKKDFIAAGHCSHTPDKKYQTAVFTKVTWE